MDTSDGVDNGEPVTTGVANFNFMVIPNPTCFTDAGPGLSRGAHFAEREKTAEEQADDMVKTAEKARAQMFDVPGKDVCLEFNQPKMVITQNITQMDEDNQMIDAHIDENMKCKIQNFKFVDFSKLISKSRTQREDDQ